MSKVRYIDAFAHKTTHEMFNASLLVMCSLVFEQVEYIAGKSSSGNVMQLAKYHLRDNVTPRYCFVCKGDSRWMVLARFIGSAVQNIRFLVSAPKDCVIVYNYNNLFSLRLLNWINKLLKKKVLIFCHGELEFLSSGINKAGLLSRLLNFLANNFYFNKHIKIAPDLYFGVMGEKIKENLGHILSQEQMNKFICIDHSYIFKTKAYSDHAQKNSGLLRLGTVGVMNKAKGIDRYVELFHRISAQEGHKPEFFIVGNVQTDTTPLKSTDIIYQEGYKPLDRDEYEHRINRLDYILYFYSDQAYKITASGAIFDAINMAKPIIAIRNDFFQYLFDKYGVFGYLVNNIAQMAELIEKITQESEDPVFDFQNIQWNLSPLRICRQLQNELHRIGYLLEDSASVK